MALTGTFTRNLDEKQRLAVPKPLRDAFGEESDSKCLYVAPGTEQSLFLYSAKGFEALAERFASQSRNDPSTRNYMRLFYARAEQVSVDSQGRVRIPDRLIQLAGLQHEIVVLGVHDHAEIWDKGRWEAFLDQSGPSFDELATRALDWS
jgi:MraZ protein